MAIAGTAATLYLIEILHQTTTSSMLIFCVQSCILSKFYIKPQQEFSANTLDRVVSYRNSTSNHNYCRLICLRRSVVSYRNSTSNHNRLKHQIDVFQLYLIEILHQTTTGRYFFVFTLVLYLIEILHQTTTWQGNSYKNIWLYLIEILHQTTTSGLILIDKVLLTGCLPL